MKRFLLIALTSLLATSAGAIGPVDIEAELPLYSKYVWRGMTQVDDYVLQPSLNAGLLGFTIGVWANLDLTDVNHDQGEFKEVDFTLGYGLGLGIVELGAGFHHFQFPQSVRDNTTEFYLGGQVNVLLSPSLVLFQDIDNYKGAYWALSVGHEFGTGKPAQVDLTAGLGFGSKKYIQGYLPVDPDPAGNHDWLAGGGPADFYLATTFPFQPVPFLTIAPSLTWTSLLGDAQKSMEAVPDGSLYAGRTQTFYWGLSASFGF